MDTTANVISVDLHGPSATIGALDFLGTTTGAVVVYPARGQRRLLTVIEDIAGMEPLRFSGNGEWLLVPTSKHSTLIEVSTGR